MMMINLLPFEVNFIIINKSRAEAAAGGFGKLNLSCDEKKGYKEQQQHKLLHKLEQRSAIAAAAFYWKSTLAIICLNRVKHESTISNIS